MNKNRSSTAILSSTVGQKWLKKEMDENFEKNIGTLGCEETVFSTVSTILEKNWYSQN